MCQVVQDIDVEELRHLHHLPRELHVLRGEQREPIEDEVIPETEPIGAYDHETGVAVQGEQISYAF